MNDLSEKLNLVGVASLFGGDTALSALHYSLLSEGGLYTYAIVSPGLQTVASKIFKRIDNRISQSLSPGERDDPKEIVGLKSRGNYKYVGLHSGTNMTIRSVLGEAIIRKYSKFDESKIVTMLTREINVERNIKLSVIKVGNIIEEETKQKVVEKSKWHIKVLCCIIPLISVASIGGLVVIKDYIIVAVVALNIIINMLVVRTTKANGCDYPKGHASGDSPQGDILIEDLNSDGNLYLVIGSEDSIQYLFQKSIKMSLGKWKIWNFIIGILAFFVSMINLIAIPFATFYGQLWFGVLLLLGLVQNILLANFDGDELICDLANKIVPINDDKCYSFDNRTTALSYCMLISKSPNNHALEILAPRSSVWIEWCNEVSKSGKEMMTVKEIDEYNNKSKNLLNGLIKNMDASQYIACGNKKSA
jgi:hypothetical protein